MAGKFLKWATRVELEPDWNSERNEWYNKYDTRKQSESNSSMIYSTLEGDSRKVIPLADIRSKRAARKNSPETQREREKTEAKKDLLRNLQNKEKLLSTGRYFIEINWDKQILYYKGMASNNKTVYLHEVNSEKFEPVLWYTEDYNKVPRGEYRTDGKYVVRKDKMRKIEGNCKELWHGYLLNGEKLRHNWKIVDTFTRLEKYPNERIWYRKERKEDAKIFDTEKLKFIWEILNWTTYLTDYPELKNMLTDGKFIIKGECAREWDPKEDLAITDNWFLYKGFQDGQLKLPLVKAGVNPITKWTADNYHSRTPYYEPLNGYRSGRRRY